MDNLDLFNIDNGEEKAEGKTSLEFEISEQAPAESEPEVEAVAVSTSPEEPVSVDTISAAQNDKTGPQDEFVLPDSFEASEGNPNYLETPSGIKPTYIPRFTEVSDTYRMQNDPRPRPKNDTHTVRVADTEASSADLDPTTERLEDKEVEKIVVAPSPIRTSEPTDETLTVLKFSTPSYEDDLALQSVAESDDGSAGTDNAEEGAKLPVEEAVSDEAPAEDAESAVLDSESGVGSDEEKPKNTTIPDPDASFQVVEFTSPKIGEEEEPLGASDTDKKDRAASHFEFTAPIQRESVKDRFLDTLMSIKVRLAGALILLFVMVAVDCLNYFGVNLLSYVGLGNLPIARAVIDMQFSICIFLFTVPEAVGAFKMLLKGKLTPELVNVLSLAVIILNDLAVVAQGAVNYVTFGVLFGLQCVITIIAFYHRTESNFASFKLVSRNVAKNVIDRRLTRDLQRENLALDGAIDEYNSKTARMFRTVFVSNFFKRTAISCENFVNVSIMAAISAGLALVTGLVSFFLDGYSLVSGTQSFTAVFMLAYPIFSILNHKLPLKYVGRSAAVEESAFVGESSVLEAADVDVFTYEDTEIFGIEDVSIRKVHLYGKAYNTPKAMKQMYALFSVVGGPLDFVFSSALDRKCSPAEDIVIEDNGIRGVMDGHVISAGTEEYMIANGIAIPEDDYRTNTSSSDSTKVMYGAEDGEVYVKFFIRYSFSEEFTMLLPELKDKKIVPLIYTRDPNITNDLLKVLTLGEDVMRVMKKYVPRISEEKTYRRIDSGIITHGNKDNAINAVLLAKKYAAFQRSLETTELIAMISGATLAVVLSIGGMLTVPATLLSLWQIVWCAVLHVRSKIAFQCRQNAEDGIDAE